jgi:hypothetical protein
MKNEKWEKAERIGNKIRLRAKTFFIFIFSFDTPMLPYSGVNKQAKNRLFLT